MIITSEETLADLLHYPICWDTAAYPTVFDALVELDDYDLESHGFVCTNPECPFKNRLVPLAQDSRFLE